MKLFIKPTNAAKLLMDETRKLISRTELCLKLKSKYLSVSFYFLEKKKHFELNPVDSLWLSNSMGWRPF